MEFFTFEAKFVGCNLYAYAPYMLMCLLSCSLEIKVHRISSRLCGFRGEMKTKFNAIFFCLFCKPPPSDHCNYVCDHAGQKA